MTVGVMFKKRSFMFKKILPLISILVCLSFLIIGCSKNISQEAKHCGETAVNAVENYLDGNITIEEALATVNNSETEFNDFRKTHSYSDDKQESNDFHVDIGLTILSNNLFLHSMGDVDEKAMWKACNDFSSNLK